MIYFVDGDRMEVYKEVIEFVKREGIIYVIYWFNFYFIEGMKFIVYEIYE